MLEVGIKGESSVRVEGRHLATVAGSGELPVFATPYMIALMELTASASVRDHVGEGKSTVGTLVNVKHLASTPQGMTVRCESVLTEIDGRRLVFEVRAYDECELIGEGTHERFIISCDKFMQKTAEKGKK